MGGRGCGCSINLVSIFVGFYLLCCSCLRFDELMTQEGALKLKEKLLEQEKDLMVSQNEWLTQELNGKSEQLIQLRKERFSTIANLNAQLATKNEEVGE